MEVSGQLHALAALFPGKEPLYPWVGPRAVLDAVVKRKIASTRRESNHRTPIMEPVAQRYTTELSRLFVLSKWTSNNNSNFF
jgi:hypothetical protein